MLMSPAAKAARLALSSSDADEAGWIAGNVTDRAGLWFRSATSVNMAGPFVFGTGDGKVILIWSRSAFPYTRMLIGRMVTQRALFRP